MVKDLLNELKNSLFSVLPIYFLVLVLEILNIVYLEEFEIINFTLATLFVIIGLILFNYGAEHAMKPIGQSVGKGITKKGNVGLLILAVFLFGLVITIAEPDLVVLANQTSSIFNNWLLIIMVSLSVGFFLIFAVLKIIKKISLPQLLSLFYLFAFGITSIICLEGKENMIGMAFDSGGVTTGPMTVPFLLALGSGVSAVLAQKSEKDSSFGFIAFSSIGPIIVVLILTMFSNGSLNYELSDYSISSNYFLSYGKSVLSEFLTVGESVGILVLCFLFVDIFILKMDKKQLFNLFKGILLVYFGLVLFLAAVNSTYMGIGFKIGEMLSSNDSWLVLIIAFIIGALTVLAEPAIKVLVSQVEEATNGMIKRSHLLITLAIGVGCAILLAMLRIIFKFSILYIIIPGYVICFILSFFIPKVYTAIAFDAGGVASGPLTSSFILPIALGFCSALNGNDLILNYGFGIVALVALSPLISIELLGVGSNIVSLRASKKAIKKALKEGDKVLIIFGGSHENK